MQSILSLRSKLFFKENLFLKTFFFKEMNSQSFLTLEWQHVQSLFSGIAGTLKHRLEAVFKYHLANKHMFTSAATAGAAFAKAIVDVILCHFSSSTKSWLVHPQNFCIYLFCKQLRFSYCFLYLCKARKVRWCIPCFFFAPVFTMLSSRKKVFFFSECLFFCLLLVFPAFQVSS